MRFFYALTFLFLFAQCSPLKQYPKSSYAWASPEIEYFKALNKNDAPENALLFLGSSSIRLWETLAQDMAPYPVIQRGYGGAHLRDAIFYTEVLLGDYQPEMIIGFIANDIKGDPADESPAKVKRLFKFFLKQIRKRHPSTPFLWVEITPTKSRWAQWEDIQKVNQKIKAYCDKTPNVYFIETTEAFLTKEGLPRTDLFVADQLHLNPQGYALWSSIIRKQIESHLD